MRILAELHWQLPRPLSCAEVALRDATLPEADAAMRELQRNAQARRHTPLNPFPATEHLEGCQVSLTTTLFCDGRLPRPWALAAGSWALSCLKGCQGCPACNK